MSWQTMETAPDDGKPDGPRFLATLKGGGVTIVHRVNQYECADGTMWPACAPFWGTDNYSYAGAFHMADPIAWQPLPEPFHE